MLREPKGVDSAVVGENEAVVSSRLDFHGRGFDLHLGRRRDHARKVAQAQLAVAVLSKGENSSFLLEHIKLR
jgi:hypothetical protein